MRACVFVFSVFALLHSQSYGQKRLVDSLKNRLNTHHQEDSVRVSLLTQLAYKEHSDHPANAARYAMEALTISEKINYPEGMALSYRLLGAVFWAQASYSLSLDYCL